MTQEGLKGLVNMTKTTAVPGKLGSRLRLFSTVFTDMVNTGDTLSSGRAYSVTRRAKRKEKRISAESSSVRATISFPPDLYATLEEIARKNKVSLAWVVRDAAEQYVAGKWPLFKRRP
jgi:hypothetical protein